MENREIKVIRNITSIVRRNKEILVNSEIKIRLKTNGRSIILIRNRLTRSMSGINIRSQPASTFRSITHPR